MSSTFGQTEDARFQEHFRYLLVASQLLNEFPELGSLHTTQAESRPDAAATSQDYRYNQPLTVAGAAVATGLAFAVILLLHWARSTRLPQRKLLVAVACVATFGVLLYVRLRLQGVKHLRQRVITSASDLTANIRGLELTSTAALSLIQEVELVSKGYRLSIPLPPVSRIDDAKGQRKCAKLRRCLKEAYSAVLPAFRDGYKALRMNLDEDAMENFLDVYDIPHHAIQEATDPTLVEAATDDDLESLRSLRQVAYQYTTLRRLVLCCLMSLQPENERAASARWNAAVDTMRSLATTAAVWAEQLNDLLREAEGMFALIPVMSVRTNNFPDFSMPPSLRSPVKPTNERLRGQIRNITNVSSGIRSLQAKMALMREESNNAIEKSEDLTDLGPILLAQYESVGTDLKLLMQAWETGKASLANNIDRQERRISRASSVLRSPASSLGGLTAVDEGGPEEALRALTGADKSNRSSLAASNSDEEVFEGISLPRQRSMLTREERISKMYEERARQTELNAKRESNTNMIRELQSVVRLRQPGRNSIGRVTSI